MHASLRGSGSTDADGGHGDGGRGSSLAEGDFFLDEEHRVQSGGDGGPSMLRVPPPLGAASTAAPTPKLSSSVHAQLMAQPINMQGISQHLASGVVKGQAFLTRAVGHRAASEGAVAPMVVALLLLLLAALIVALLTRALLTLPIHYAYRQTLDRTRPSCLRCHPIKWRLGWWTHGGWGRERGARWTKIDTFSGPVCPDDENADELSLDQASEDKAELLASDEAGADEFEI